MLFFELKEKPGVPVDDVQEVSNYVAAIHPFLDGNGRVGRRLITLLLCNGGVLKQPPDAEPTNPKRPEKIASLGRAAASTLTVHQAMLRHPISDTIKLKELTGLANATINSALARLLKFGIIEETTGNKRNRLFCYDRYIFPMLARAWEG